MFSQIVESTWHISSYFIFLVHIVLKIGHILSLFYLGKTSIIPHKKSKNSPLTDEQKAENKESAKIRIVIEYVNRRCKIFRLVKDTYRDKHRNYNKNWNCVAGLVNTRYLSE